MKGVVLAGGTGSRLNPLTRVTNKHLLPIYDKPMVYYRIQTLVNAGIHEILLVTGGKNAGEFLRLLGNGRDFGLQHLNYTYQEGEGGIAEALGLAEYFAGNEPICVVLGDNIIENNICRAVENFGKQKEGAKVLLKEVTDANVSALRKFAEIACWGLRKSPRIRNRTMRSSESICTKDCLSEDSPLETIRTRGARDYRREQFLHRRGQAHLRGPGRLVDRCRNVRISSPGQ